MREKLPGRRLCQTFELVARAHLLTASMTAVAPEEDLVVKEVFLDAAKADSQIGCDLRDLGILVSMLLQHGTPLAAIAGSLTRDGEGRPLGLAGEALDAILEAVA